MKSNLRDKPVYNPTCRLIDQVVTHNEKVLTMIVKLMDSHTSDWATCVLVVAGVLGFFVAAGIFITFLRFIPSLLTRKESNAIGKVTNEKKSLIKNITSFLQCIQRDEDYETVSIIKSFTGDKKIGIRLEGGLDNPVIQGDPAIFINSVRPNSPAHNKLFPGDRIVSINNEQITRVTLFFAKQLIRVSRGAMRFNVKRASTQQKQIHETLNDYKKKYKAVFTNLQIEEIADGFAFYDKNSKGKVKTKLALSMVRSLGYNLHEAEIWVYLNELGYTANPTISLHDFVKLMNIIVAQNESYEDDIKFAYSVFDSRGEGFIATDHLVRAIDRMPGRSALGKHEIEGIKRLGDRNNDKKINFTDFRRLLMPTMKMY